MGRGKKPHPHPLCLACLRPIRVSMAVYSSYESPARFPQRWLPYRYAMVTLKTAPHFPLFNQMGPPSFTRQKIQSTCCPMIDSVSAYQLLPHYLITISIIDA